MENDIGVGDLWGNQFGLILRLINPSDSQFVEERINSLKEIGMINYFGMQRFGSCGTKTHMIGLKLVKKKWKEVVEELLLEHTPDDSVNKLKAECYNNE
jgi:tRNA pseudouridine13 synthase